MFKYPIVLSEGSRRRCHETVHVCPLTRQRCSTSQRARHIPKENCQKFSSSPLAGNVSEQTNEKRSKKYIRRKTFKIKLWNTHSLSTREKYTHTPAYWPLISELVSMKPKGKKKKITKQNEDLKLCVISQKCYTYEVNVAEVDDDHSQRGALSY